MREMHCVIAAAAGLAMAASALATSIGPSLGTVEFRWRERSTSGYNGMYALPNGAAASSVVTNGASPTAAQVTVQDAVVVLVLEARVTQAASLPAGISAIRGLQGAQFDITTNQTSGGAFRSIVVADGNPAVNPRGGAVVGGTTAGSVGGVNLGLGGAPNALLPGAAISNRGVVAPFRGVANNNSANGPAVGVLSANQNTLGGVFLGEQPQLFGPEDDYAGQYQYLGQDAWVPVYCAIYDITDVTSVRTVTFSIRRWIGTWPYPVGDTWLQTSTGVLNPQNPQFDAWALSPATTGYTPESATFSVIIPAPGGAAWLALGSVLVARRRRA